MKMTNQLRCEASHERAVVGRKSSSYGFYPQMKAEGMAFKKEKSVAVVVGTNPGFQMGVLIVYESDDRPSNIEDK